MSRRRILIVTSTYPRWKNDTVPRFVHELSRRLTTDFEVHVLAPSTPGTAKYEVMDNVHVHRFRYFLHRFETLANVEGFLPALKAGPWRALLLPFFLLSEIWAIGQTARRYEVSLIHAHWIVPQGFCVWLARMLWRLKQPVVTTCHGADLFALNGRFFRYLKRQALADASTVTVVSEAGRKKLLELGVGTTHLLVYPMGADLAQLFVPDRSINRYQRRILFVGRLSEKKGVSVLIKALALVRQTIPDVEADIVGYGPDYTTLANLTSGLSLDNIITFHGAVEQEALPSFYNRASCLVFPSVVARSGDQEGLGLVIIEALGCGCPIVASRLEAINDVVQDNRTGLQFTPNDHCDLADKLVQLLTNPDQALAMAREGQARVRAHYNWDMATDNYRRLFLTFTEAQKCASVL